MSQLIFNDGKIKSRLVRKDINWFVGEWKYVNDFDENKKPQYTGYISEKNTQLGNIWFPWIWGTKEWLQLTEQEIAWSISK